MLAELLQVHVLCERKPALPQILARVRRNPFDMQDSSQLVFGLTGSELLGWFDTAVQAFEECQDTLNRANVFPVPDADTGTNMLLTVRGAVHGAREADPRQPALLLARAAYGALTHARGNSGIILAEYLGGLARSVQATAFAEAGTQLAQALGAASSSAYGAVAQPVEGTILSAARAGANGALGVAGSSPSEVIAAAITGATEALDRSHVELEVLARAGVLDAGAYGLIVLLSALQQVLSGAPIVRRELGSAVVSESDGAVHADGEFEVMCLIRVPDEALIFDDTVAHTAAFRRVLSQLGESVVVIGGVSDSGVTVWSAHMHTNMPDQAITALESELSGVVLSQVVVRNLERQVAVSDGSGAAVRLVVCTSGPLLALDLARAGAVVCVERAQGLGVADVERALTEVHGASKDHGSDHETALDAVVIVNSSRLSRELENMSRVVGTVVAMDDAQVVAATSAVLTAWEHEPELAAQRLTEIGQDCVDSLVTMRLEELDRARLAPLVNEIAAHEVGVPVVTVLTDTDCPPSVIADLTDGLERAHEDVEVIVLGSGTLGRGLTASVEWIDD